MSAWDVSRAGDPHRHLHVQVNARVFAAGKWRGLDTVAFRDSIGALNGIGHAAVACDPEFRAALAAHGFTLNRAGEIEQLARFVGPFSKRAAQIAGLLDRYETHWRTEHPGAEPGPRLRRAWDARAWAEDRPDKVVARSGETLRQRWLAELAGLGYRDRDQPLQLALPMAGALNRDAAAAEVVTRLGAARSAWNAADLRGEVEQLLARTGIIADPAVRLELAEDLTARACDLCILLREQSAPEHIRVLTSRHVLDVEADLVARLAARGAATVRPVEPATVHGLDVGQQAAVAALASDAQLVVVEGAAGAGKTTTLAAIRDQLTAQHHRLVVVTPTLKAAQAASAELRAHAGSAAWLAWQHGWRWDDTGAWRRLRASELDPITGHVYRGPQLDAHLRRGDLLLVDEAGMLDQDTARAVLAIADEAGARVALVGDRRQLPAVGRGGVFDLAHRWVHRDGRVDLDSVHRFVHTVDGRTVPDIEYAQLSLAIRAGDNPAAVFDALHARGQITVHASELERRDALAARVAATRLGGVTTSVVVDTREHAATLNATIRDRLVAAGAVDDHRAVMTADGQRIGAGDAVVTRRNDPTLGVANRETWMVTRVHRDGELTVLAADRGGRQLSAGYVRDHLELGYATTGYGAQGDTTEAAHLVVTETTTAAAAYVGMTRGREANTAHLVAEHLDDAREQWITAFSRERADLGPTAAREAAARAAAGYFPAWQPDDPARLADVLDQLHQAWAEQLVAHRQLHHVQQRLGRVQEQAAWSVHCQRVLSALEADRDDARVVAEQAEQAAAGCAATLTTRAEQHAAGLRRAWDAELPGADHAARVLAAGPGPLGVHRGRMRAAQRHLDTWANRWAPAFPDGDLDMPTLRRWPIGYPSNVPRIAEALYQHAHRLAAADHPDQAARLNTARQARERYDATATVYHQGRRHLEQVSHRPVDDTSAAELIPDLTAEVAAAQHRVAATDERVATLSLDPAISRQPDPDALLHGARDAWHADRVADHQQRALAPAATARSTRHDAHPTPQIDHGPGIGR